MRLGKEGFGEQGETCTSVRSQKGTANLGRVLFNWVWKIKLFGLLYGCLGSRFDKTQMGSEVKSNAGNLWITIPPIHSSASANTPQNSVTPFVTDMGKVAQIMTPETNQTRSSIENTKLS
jgi:hypothetical protein